MAVGDGPLHHISDFANSKIFFRETDVECLIVDPSIGASKAQIAALMMSSMCTIGRHGVPSLLM